MARATVIVAGRTSRPAPAPVRGAAASRNSLVDRPFLKPFLVRKIRGKGTERGRAVEKVALVTEDNTTMLVAPTNTGDPAVFVKRAAADKNYEFVRYLRTDESISFPGLGG